MARALREASTKIDFRSAPCAGGDSNQTPSGPGHQRGSPSRGASTARISPDAAVFGARLQLRYLEEKAASGAAAYARRKQIGEHTSELQSRLHLVCRLLLGK